MYRSPWLSHGLNKTFRGLSCTQDISNTPISDERDLHGSNCFFMHIPRCLVAQRFGKVRGLFNTLNSCPTKKNVLMLPMILYTRSDVWDKAGDRRYPRSCCHIQKWVSDVGGYGAMSHKWGHKSTKHYTAMRDMLLRSANSFNWIIKNSDETFIHHKRIWDERQMKHINRHFFI